jgi:hypothetical protein
MWRLLDEKDRGPKSVNRNKRLSKSQGSTVNALKSLTPLNVGAVSVILAFFFRSANNYILYYFFRNIIYINYNL